MDSDVATLIGQALKVGKGELRGDPTPLLKALRAVKKFLCDNLGKPGGVGTLVEFPGFLELLGKCLCLKGEACLLSEVQLDSAWILEMLIALSRNKPDVKAVIKAGLVPLVVNLLSSTDDNVYQQAVSTIAVMATNDSSRDTLISISDSLMAKLKNHLGEEKMSSKTFTYQVSYILRGLVLRETRRSIQDTAMRSPLIYSIYADIYRDRMNSSCQDVNKVAQVALEVLTATGNEKILNQVLHCLSVLGFVSPNIKAIVSSDFTSKLVSFLAHPDKKLQEAAIVIIGRFAAVKTDLIWFLKEVKDSKELRSYTNAFKIGIEKSRQLEEAVRSLINGLQQLIDGGTLKRGTKTLITSGLFHALLLSLSVREPEVPMDTRVSILKILEKVATTVELQKREIFVETPAHTQALLSILNYPHPSVMEIGYSILDALMEEPGLDSRREGETEDDHEEDQIEFKEFNSPCKRKLLAAGIIDTLLAALKKKVVGDECILAAKVLQSFVGALKQTKVPLPLLKDAPRIVFEILGLDLDDDVAEMFFVFCLNILSGMAARGKKGIAMIVEVDGLLKRISNLLAPRYQPFNDLQTAAACTFLCVAKGRSPVFRRAVKETGVLQTVENILVHKRYREQRSLLPNTARLILKSFPVGELTSSQVATMEKGPFVLSQVMMAKENYMSETLAALYRKTKQGDGIILLQSTGPGSAIPVVPKDVEGYLSSLLDILRK